MADHIRLNAETAAQHKYFCCTEKDTEWFIAILQVHPDHCTVLDLDTFQERQYNYDLMNESIEFLAISAPGIQTIVHERLKKLNNDVTEATVKRDKYINAMSRALLGIVLS